MMKRVSVVVPIDIFNGLVDYGKRMKSTFTVVDFDSVYGFNGVVSERTKSFQLGCMKQLITDSFTPLIVRGVDDTPLRFAILTKNLTALSKTITKDVILDYNIENGYISPQYLGNGTTCVELYDALRMINAKLYLSSYMKNILFSREITDDPNLIRICNMKAEVGGDLLRLPDFPYPIFTINNILSVNKGDRIYLTVYKESGDSAIAEFTVSKTKKKFSVKISYRILLL